MNALNHLNAEPDICHLDGSKSPSLAIKRARWGCDRAVFRWLILCFSLSLFIGLVCSTQGQPDATPPGFVWISPGTFVMGSPTSEPQRQASGVLDEVQHQVTLTHGFWISQYEVTQDQYQTLTGANPSHFNSDGGLPVEQVSWNDATNYCGLLTAVEANAGRLPAACAYRLATEAEWEYACRAGTTTATAFGDSLSSSKANFNGQFPYNGAAIGPYLEPVPDERVSAVA
jgi:formylglycine-generating enzyme required for sulfatase activity